MDQMTSRLALMALHDVEEDIWSSTYGLKGKLDASVQVLIEQKKVVTSKLSLHMPGDSDTRIWTMPFEIKTGKSTGLLEHRAQTMLYTLLMAERYGALPMMSSFPVFDLDCALAGVEVPGGLLYYTQSKELMSVSMVRNEVKDLIMARNELASYMMRKRVNDDQGDGSMKPGARVLLPPTIDDEYKCGKCYVVDGCMLYRKVRYCHPFFATFFSADSWLLDR